MIADAYSVVLLGLRALLETDNTTYRIAGEAQTSDELFTLLATSSADLVITGLSMRNSRQSVDEFALLDTLRKRHPDLPVIVFTKINQPLLIRNVLAYGAQGVVHKGEAGSELLLAIQAVTHGRAYVGASLRSELTRLCADQSSDDTTSTERKDGLSPCEEEVTQLLIQGLTITQIAQHRGCSIKTISEQKSNAMRKLGVSNSRQLHDYAKTRRLRS